MKKYTILLSGPLVLLPTVASAQFSNARDLNGLVDLLIGYSSRIIVLLVVIALAVFFWRIVISIYRVGDDPKAVSQGKTLLFWGIIALFVMVSIWAIVSFIGESLGINNGRGAIIPQLEGHNR